MKEVFFSKLDGVRGIAIALVVLFHWLPKDYNFNDFPFGPIGVTIFFVLSGFLITRILLISSRDTSRSTKSKYLVFFFRRVLRIFPIYYLLLLVLWLLNYEGVNVTSDFYARPSYYLFFSYNFLLEQTQNWSDFLSPFWSIAVEEQFYIFWALFLLNIKNEKLLKSFFIFAIIFGVASRYYLIYLHHGIGLHMPTCIDCFAWGGIYAYYYQHNRIDFFEKNLLYYGLGSLICFFLIYVYRDDLSLLHTLFFRTFISLASLGLIVVSTSKSFQSFSSILDFKPLLFVGKISYGIYLYHMVLPMIVLGLLNRFKVKPSFINDDNLWLFSFVILLSGSYISWVIIEKPSLQLKKYVNQYFN